MNLTGKEEINYLQTTLAQELREVLDAGGNEYDFVLRLTELIEKVVAYKNPEGL